MRRWTREPFVSVIIGFGSIVALKISGSICVQESFILLCRESQVWRGEQVFNRLFNRSLDATVQPCVSFARIACNQRRPCAAHGS